MSFTVVHRLWLRKHHQASQETSLSPSSYSKGSMHYQLATQLLFWTRPRTTIKRLIYQYDTWVAEVSSTARQHHYSHAAHRFQMFLLKVTFPRWNESTNQSSHAICTISPLMLELMLMLQPHWCYSTRKNNIPYGYFYWWERWNEIVSTHQLFLFCNQIKSPN